ncbi:MAG: CopG family transcriptional regulator [Chroococcidiopsis sp.]
MITLRLTDFEWLQLEKYSAKVGRSKNEVIRELIRGLPEAND